MKFYWPPTKWSKVYAPDKFVLWLQLSHGPVTSRNLLNYYITLAHLSAGRFAFYDIRRNDLQERL